MPDPTAALPQPVPGALPMRPSGIRGLDNICAGGLPEGEVTLLTGAAGTGKSVLASHFLAAGIRDFGEAGVFVTLDEQPAKTRRFMATLGWDISGWEAAGTWAFLDLSPSDDREIVISDDVDFSSLITRIATAVNRVGAKRVAVDSITNLLTRVGNQPRVRAEVHRLVRSLEQMGVTAVVTAERDQGAASARLDVEEFVADNVLILRNALEGGVRRRTLEALKLRGTPHLTGEFPYAIRPGEGVVVSSLAELQLTYPCSDLRVSLGNPDVDAMCHGGAMKDSFILLSGPTGTGKSLLALEFATAAGEDEDGRCLMINFEESAQQLTRNARGWGHDLDALEADGRLRLLCQYPESAPAPAHLIQIQRVVDEFRPTRVVVDSLSGVQRSSSDLVFHEFLLGLTSGFRARGITSLMTTTTPSLLGGPSASGVEASTLLDMIILLRYMELFGELRRGISILKLRGSDHSKAIMEFTITDHGLRMGAPLPATTGILAGQPLIADLSGRGGVVGNRSAPLDV